MSLKSRFCRHLLEPCAWACVQSCRSPPVTMNRSGLPNASHTACSFVVNPPRQRPKACVGCPLLRQRRVDGRE